MAVSNPLFLHTKMATVDAIDLRRAMLDTDIQAGVMGAGDLLVAQTGVASMNVTVAAGAAWVRGTNITRQGLYDIYNDASVSLNIAANPSGNPRLDQIIARIYDSSDGGNNQDIAAVEVLQGTANAGATLNTRTGAAALPANAILLADILVANGAASITNSVIRDRRPWARGFFQQVIGVTSSPTPAGGTATPGAFITDMSIVGEFTGVPVVLSFEAQLSHSVANTGLFVLPLLDGAALPGFAATDDTLVAGLSPSSVLGTTMAGTLTFTPAAGRHTVTLNTWATTAGTITAILKRRAMTVEEMIRQNVGNNPAGYG